MRKYIRNFLIVGLVLANIPATTATPLERESTEVSNKIPAEDAQIHVVPHKKITWKQIISRRYMQARKFISGHKDSIVALSILSAIFIARPFIDYKLESDKKERRSNEEREREALFAERAAAHRIAQQEQINLRQPLMDLAIRNGRRDLPPLEIPRIAIELFERVPNRANAPAQWDQYRLLGDVFNSATPQGALLRDTVKQDAKLYGNETQEQYQNACEKINLLMRATHQLRIPRDIKMRLLLEGLPDAVSTIGFYQLRNNPERMRLMPVPIRIFLINAMTIRHQENLRENIHNLNALMRIIRNSDDLNQRSTNDLFPEWPEIQLTAQPLLAYSIPAIPELHQIMRQRIQAFTA